MLPNTSSNASLQSPRNLSEDVDQALRRISRSLELHSRFLAGRYGLTSPQLSILKELEHHGEMAVCQLARAAHLSQATVTGILDRLERSELVFRHRSELDKRRVLVRLTEEGTTLLSGGPTLLQERFIRRLEQLESWEQSMLLSALQRIAAMMETPDLVAPNPHPQEEMDVPTPNPPPRSTRRSQHQTNRLHPGPPRT